MREIQELSLKEAMGHIRNTCDNCPQGHPFFFLVGAGISHPPIPLARDIVSDCKKHAQRYGSIDEPSTKSSTDAYSYWFQKAYHSPADRQGYLRKLIEERFISHANFHLAHLLLDKRVSNLVVTTNFDDFLSRALNLFGRTYIVCDHPGTIERIDPEREDIQIVHVHGTYWFYDCCNLKGEIRERSKRSTKTAVSMADWLTRVCSKRSPLVVGYSGWEDDVVMSVLKRRLLTNVGYNFYWFCYRASDVVTLPDWLKFHPNVCFVVPPRIEGDGEAPLALVNLVERPPIDAPGSSGRGHREIADTRGDPTLDARHVFESLIQIFELPAPTLVRDPLAFLAEHLRRDLPREEGEPNSYFFGTVIQRLELAGRKLQESIQAVQGQMEGALDAVRRSQYREAIRAGAAISKGDLDPGQLRELMNAIWVSSTRLLDDSEEELRGYEEVLSLVEILASQGVSDLPLQERAAKAFLYKGITLGSLGRPLEAIAAYDEVVRRFEDAVEAGLREQVAEALVNKGFTLGALNRSEEAIAVYDEAVRRFGDAVEAGLRERVARALVSKGFRLGALNRSEEGIAVYDEVVRRFGDAVEAGLREEVAEALVNKGFRLGALNRSEEEIAVYDEVVRRFGDAVEAGLREQVARALVNKGFTLGDLNRSEEEIAVYDEVVRRFGDAVEASLRKQVAKALNGIGFAALCAAKQSWASGDEQSARARLSYAGMRIAASLERWPENPSALGNLAYTEFLLEDREKARVTMTRAIELGGEELRRAELEHSQIHRLPQDEDFRTMVNSIPGRTDDPPRAEAAGGS
ncbi:MAG: SIR2 family protein [Acidobacteria bacterium]|nr:SIR2 family protein [Acidobacteriota bacterium]